MSNTDFATIESLELQHVTGGLVSGPGYNPAKIASEAWNGAKKGYQESHGGTFQKLGAGAWGGAKAGGKEAVRQMQGG